MLAFHADVLEVIAEYACGTVADACALRGSCKGYRRAVDTTVRRLVYEDQPNLLLVPETDSNDRAAVLKLDGDGSLDAIRVAFTCDRHTAFVRLVVVAFALDGPKDDLHESGVCGERPVAASASTFLMLLAPDHPDDDDDDDDEGDDDGQPPPMTTPAGMRRGLQRSMTQATVCSLTRALFEDASLWPRVTALSFELDGCVGAFAMSDGSMANDDDDDDDDAATDVDEALRCLVRLLVAMGPGLTALDIAFGETPSDAAVANELCPALATCAGLTSLAIASSSAFSSAVSRGLCDSVIAAGAPLEDVTLYCMGLEDRIRLLGAVPTIHTAAMDAATTELTDLVSPRTVARLRSFNDEPVASPAATTQRVEDPSDWRPSLSVTTLMVAGNPGAPPAGLGLPDFRVAYPRLARLSTFGDGDAAEALHLSRARFPPTLESVNVCVASCAAANAFIAR